MPLTGKQRHHLRALAHHLDPVVQLGHEGLTEGLVAQVESALKAHELIKVRLGTECPDAREDVALALSDATKAEVAQIIGRVIVLYKRRPQKPKVELPTRSGAVRKTKGKTAGSKGRKPHKKKNTPRRTERLRAVKRRGRAAQESRAGSASGGDESTVSAEGDRGAPHDRSRGVGRGGSGRRVARSSAGRSAARSGAGAGRSAARSGGGGGRSPGRGGGGGRGAPRAGGRRGGRGGSGGSGSGGSSGSGGGGGGGGDQ